MPQYEDTNKLKGFGLVTYVNKADAQKAYQELEKTTLKDKIVISPEHSGKVKTRHVEGKK